MKHIIVYLRKECRWMWSSIVLLLVAITLSVVCALQIGHSRSEWITTIMPDVLKVLGWAIAGAIAIWMGFEDSPRRENHYLSTRPADRRIMFAAKALIVIFFAVVIATGQAITSSILGLGQSFAENFLYLVLFGLLFLFAGAHLRISVRYVILWGVAIVAISAVTFLADFLIGLGDLPQNEPPLALILGAILAFFVAAFFISYRFGKNTRLTVIAIAVFTFALIPINYISFGEKTIPADKLAEALSEREPISMTIVPASVGNFQIVPSYEPTAVGSPDILVIEATDAEVRDASGNLMPYADSRQIVSANTVNPNNATQVPFSSYLPDSDYQRMLEYSNESIYVDYGRSTLLMTPPGFATQDEEITISYTPLAKVYRLENLGEIPFRIGETLSTKDCFISVGDITIDQQTVNHRAGRKTRLDVHWQADRGERLYVILSSEKTGEFWTNDLSNYSEFTLPGGTFARSYSSITYDTRKPKELDLIPADAKLRFFRYVDLGERKLPRVSKTTSFREIFKTTVTQPLIARNTVRSSVTARRPVPLLKNQGVSEYLRSLESLSNESIYQSLAIKETLRDIARTDPEKLLVHLREKDVSPQLVTSITNALTASAPSRIMPQVIDLLPADSSLASFLVMRGWPESDELREVAAREATMPYAVRRGLAYYADEASLDALLEDLENSMDAAVYRRLLEF